MGGELQPGPYVDCPEEGCAYTLEEGLLLRHQRDRELVLQARPLPIDPELDAIEHERPRLRRIARMLAEAAATARLASSFIVFVPREGDAAAAGVQVGSGIVGAPVPGSEHVIVYFEGVLDGEVSRVHLADRVYFAHARLALDFPTEARRKLARASLVEVGTFDPSSAMITPVDADAEATIAAWLGTKELDPAELARSGGAF